ncbi:MAG TPA: hypothetical protein VL463_07695 [Kofleriaceae bacterium]|nr:hypothetical protein [Kofleriaceae bacterium]
MRKVALALVVALAGAGAAHAQPSDVVLVGPQREGFTIELGGGLGATRVYDQDGNVEQGKYLGAGVSGIDVGFGWFVSSTFAAMFRFSANTGWQALPTTNHIRSHALWAVGGQWWLEDNAFLGAGFGFSTVGGQDQEGLNDESTVGLGAAVRGGWALALNDDSAWSLGAELDASLLLDNRRAFTATALLSWQSF